MTDMYALLCTVPAEHMSDAIKTCYVRLSVVMLLCVFAFGLCKGASDGKRGVVSNDY